MADKPNTKKCANSACDCVPTDGSKFCSAHCEGVGNSTELACHCGHPGCRGDVTTAR